jgi:predicted ferric reductase
MLMLVCYVWTGIGVKRYVLAAIYLILAAGLIRSPIVVIALPVIFVGVFTDQTLGRFRSLYAFWMTIIAIFAVSLIAVLAVSVIAERLDNIATGQDYSTTYRTYGAIAVAIAVLHKYPLFGAGVGSLKPVKDIIMSTYISLGVPVEAAELNWNQSINNTYASVLVYLGLVGAVLVVMGLWRLIKTDVLRNKLPVVLALLGFFWTSGAIYTPKYVITICTILTVAKLRPVLGKIPTAVRQRRPGLLSRGDPRLNAPRSGPLPGLRENPAPQTPV